MVTKAIILNYVLLPSLCCLMNKTVKTFKQTVYLPEQCEVFECCLSVLTQTHNHFATIYWPVNNTLLEFAIPVC